MNTAIPRYQNHNACVSRIVSKRIIFCYNISQATCAYFSGNCEKEALFSEDTSPKVHDDTLVVVSLIRVDVMKCTMSTRIRETLSY